MTSVIKEVVSLGKILVKAPFYQLARAASLFYWPEKDVSGELVLITGGGSGIGKGLALKFASLGAKVILWDLDLSSANKVVKEIADNGGEAWAFQCDVTDRKRVYSLADQIRADIGHVTILINNAGIVAGKKLQEANDELMEKVVQVNTIAHFWTLKAFMPTMIEKNHGHIVTVASSAGKAGVPGLVDYCASKFGAVGVDESVRVELRKVGATGVHTTCVCPYFINTGMFDGARSKFPLLLPILEPDYVVEKITKAIRTNQTILMMPRFLYLESFLRFLLPPESVDEALEWFGIMDAMDDFKGRSKSD